MQGKRTFGLQARATLAFTHVEASPDFTVFKGYLDAAIARTAAATAPGGDPTMARQYRERPDDPRFQHAHQGRLRPPQRAVSGEFCPRLSGPENPEPPRRPERDPDPRYNVAIFNGITHKGGAQLPLGAYAIYDWQLGRHHLVFRGGVQNFWDPVVGRSPYRKTGATALNNVTQLPNYVYRYTDPVTYSAWLTAQF